MAIGSSNFDRWNLRWNLEANQEIDDQDFSQQVQQMFETDFQLSKEIPLQAWRRRGWWLRLREWFWTQVALWMDRVTQRRKRR